MFKELYFMTLSYFLKEIPFLKGKFMANVRVNGILTDKEFLSAMNRKNPDYSVNLIKEVLKLMVDTSKEILVQGNSISIPYFLRISPSIRGSFDSSEEGFNSSKHKIDVNCTVSPSFTEGLQSLITVEKIKKPDGWPKIKEIYDNKTNCNVIQKNYANRIIAGNMIVAGHEFAGLLLTCKADETKKAAIDLGKMDIIKHSQSELIFNIDRDFVSPDWLVNDTDIYIQLRYKTEQGPVVENTIFETKWAC